MWWLWQSLRHMFAFTKRRIIYCEYCLNSIEFDRTISKDLLRNSPIRPPCIIPPSLSSFLSISNLSDSLAPQKTSRCPVANSHTPSVKKKDSLGTLKRNSSRKSITRRETLWISPPKRCSSRKCWLLTTMTFPDTSKRKTLFPTPKRLIFCMYECTILLEHCLYYKNCQLNRRLSGF